MQTNTAPAHVHSDPAILYVGTPVVLVATRNTDGTANLAPISSAWWLGHTATLGFGNGSHTLANLQRTGECTLNLPSADMAESVDRLALTTGAPVVSARKQARGYRYEPDKFAVAALTPDAADEVVAPLVRECPVAMEARVERIIHGDHIIVTATVCRVHVHPGVRVSGRPNRIDPDRWRPLIMSFQHFYGLGDRVHSSRLASVDEEMYR